MLTIRKAATAGLFTLVVFGAIDAYAQGTQAPPKPPPSSEDTRPAFSTPSGDTTAMWFVPTGEVLLRQKWAVSFQYVNIDDGQGFTDVSRFPVTFAYGLGNRAEIFGNWTLVTRIDRDTRPLFFASNDEDTGTGGGITVDHPLNRQGWTGNKLGDLWVGGKVNLLASSTGPAAFAVRGQLKLPVGDEDSGASTGKMDGQFDGIISGRKGNADFGGFGGIIFRGSPDGYDLTNGLRWGFGAGFRFGGNFHFTTELFGEKYFDDQITAPALTVNPLTGEDGSLVPATSTVKSPVIFDLGLTWRANNGFYIGAAASTNLTMASRDEIVAVNPLIVAPSDGPSWDKAGVQVRIGFHPGSFARNPPPPPPPPPPPAPAPAPAPAAPANRPPVVQALCDPCTVEVGRTAMVSADAQDPDGDPLTYAWKAGAGTLATANARQSQWTAPMQPGPVQFTVTVNDGKGGTASSTVTINVVAAARKEYTFEDVHFDFDRYTLRPDALKVLDSAITAMQADSTLRLTIEGHTCNIGTTEYNMALGERRAQAVRDYLTSRGIDAGRLQVVSYGEERPKYDNDREETRRLNRRAALVVRLQ